MLENEWEFHLVEERTKAVWADESLGELRQEAMTESDMFQKGEETSIARHHGIMAFSGCEAYSFQEQIMDISEWSFRG